MLARYQFIPYIGKMKMAEVTSNDLMRLYQRLGENGANLPGRGKPLSPLTIWHTRSFLRAAFYFAIAEGDRDSNPAIKAKPKVARNAQGIPPAVDVAEVRSR